MAKLTHINPDNVPDYLTYGLSHAVAAEGGKTIYLSGQVGWNANSESVGPDLAAQLAQAHENIRRVLAEAGGTVADIVRLNTYVANYRPAEGEIVNAANKKLFEGLMPPSMTLMGVQALYSPDVLCEVEATAVIG
ncbi:MAG: RidA family protein [Rhodospirillales bacterium]|nr:RidA family protein [Rhodospirillales bacterium]MDE0378534.1 RidA family protein [Rhodospirillales bacterium]